MKRNRIQNLLEEGLRALDAADYPVALEKWSSVLAIEPGHERAARLVADLRAAMSARETSAIENDELLVVVEDDEFEAGRVPTNPQGNASFITRTSLDRLRRLVDQQAAEISSLHEELDARAAELAEVRSDVTRRERDILAVKEQLAELQSRTSSIESARRDADRSRARHESELAKAELRITERDTRLLAFEARLEESELALERAKATLAAAMEARAAAEAALAEANEAHDRTRAKGERHAARVLELERTISVARSDVAESRAAMQREVTAREALEARAQDLEALLARRTEERDRATERADAFNARIEEETTARHTSESMLDEARAEAEAVRQARDGLHRQLVALQEALTESERAQAAAHAERSEFAAAVERLRREATAAEAERATAAARVEALEAQALRMESERNEFKAWRLNAEAERDALRARVDELTQIERERDELAAALDATRETLDSFTPPHRRRITLERTPIDPSVAEDASTETSEELDDESPVPRMSMFADPEVPYDDAPELPPLPDLGAPVLEFELAHPSEEPVPHAEAAPAPVEPKTIQGAPAYATSVTPVEAIRMLASEVPERTERPVHSIPGFSARHAFVASNIDGTLSFADLLDLAGLPPEETSAILVELVRGGVITCPSADVVG